MGVVITKGERGAEVSERGDCGVWGAGDKAVQVSETPAILPIT